MLTLKVSAMLSGLVLATSLCGIFRQIRKSTYSVPKAAKALSTRVLYSTADFSITFIFSRQSAIIIHCQIHCNAMRLISSLSKFAWPKSILKQQWVKTMVCASMSHTAVRCYVDDEITDQGKIRCSQHISKYYFSTKQLPFYRMACNEFAEIFLQL